MYKYLPLLLLLTGCQLYGGASIHDRSFDSEFKEDNVITTFGISQEYIITERVLGDIFLEHDSMPFIKETEGYGVQKLGMRIKINLL